MSQKVVDNEIKAKAPLNEIRPEVELLLCCVRTSIDPETSERIKTLLQKDIDWDYLLETATKQGVRPLLYRSLNTTFPEAVPQAILGQLRDYFHANALRNLVLTKELLNLLKLFEANEIPVIPFKGPVLAVSAYGNLALREFSDLDILVHKQDFLKAKDLLISQGHRQICSYQEIYSSEEEVEYFQQAHLSGKDGKVGVDLHYEITTINFFLSLDPEPMWDRLQPVSLADMQVLTFSPEDTLLILCLNGTKEYWRSLERICSVAELLRTHQGINWEIVIKQAKTNGCERMLLIGLLLAHELLGTSLPEIVLQKIQVQPVVKSLTSQVQQWLFCEGENPLIDTQIKLFQFRVRERLQDLFLYFTHPQWIDQEFLHLPPFLSFLYYVIRPIRLIGQSGLSPGKVVRLLKLWK